MTVRRFLRTFVVPVLLLVLILVGTYRWMETTTACPAKASGAGEG